MNVKHIFKFLDSIVGEDVYEGVWRGIVAKWNVSIKTRPGDLEACWVELKSTFGIDNLNGTTGKQAFAEKLREASDLLSRMADAAEATLHETV